MAIGTIIIALFTILMGILVLVFPGFLRLIVGIYLIVTGFFALLAATGVI